MAGKRVLEAAGHEVRVFVHGHHPFGYEKAELWDDDAVRQSYQWADSVVVHNEPLIVTNIGSGKPLTVHHHGSRFRTNPEQMWRQGEEVGARQVVSTVDLLLSVPRGKSAEWMPQVCDIERPDSDRRPNAPILITHAPTNKQTKGTRHVIRASRELRTEAAFDIIMRQPWWSCLRRKARSDIFVDQLNLGYGNNAIEAWMVGLPVLASAPGPIIERMLDEFGGDLPFFLTSAETLADDLRPFIESADLREEWAQIGMRHVERFHAPDAWLAHAERLYMGDVLQDAAT
jgi:hypothetical protein